MKKPLILLVATIFVTLTWLMLSRNSGDPKKELISGNAPQSVPEASVATNGGSAAVSGRQNGKYPRWEGGRATDLSDPRWKIIHEREKSDRGWQGRMPIDFFGKVIDLEGRPVESATINFSWTDLSRAGSSRSIEKSDVNGLFSLRNAQGKNLGVEVAKEGYYTAKQDRYSFEYAAFYEESFHQPDANDPVIFRLRKKQAAESLAFHQQEVKISIGSTSEVALGTGAKLQIDLITNPQPKQGPWSMRVSVLNGGLQPTIEEFPFSAPPDKYQSSLVSDDNTPKPPTWESLYQGGSFYLKAGSNYGRIEIQMIPGKDWMRIKSWMNPSGSQNLEFDPAKTIPAVKP